MGREFKNWYFKCILPTILRKSLIQSFSLEHLLIGLDHFELYDSFLAKKGQIYKTTFKICIIRFYIQIQMKHKFIGKIFKIEMYVCMFLFHKIVRRH
jgi:hypothetical protein